MKHFLTICLVLFQLGLMAQSAKTLQDSIYQDYIASVQFRVLGAELTMPVIDLSDGQLHLSFDDIEGNNKTFYYTIIHCNKDWTPSEDLNELNYIDGFTEDEIRQFEFSMNTLQPYTHYDLVLPNTNMKWTLSGNYILKIYTSDDEEGLVMTRRFIVTDSKVRVLAEVGPAFGTGKMNSHQEVDFKIDYKGYKISSPKQEVSVSVLQNGNWATEQSDIKPLFVRPEQLEYNYQGKIVFSATREYRFLDIRSFRFGSERVQTMETHQDGTDIFVIPEEKRFDRPYLSRQDMNGNFIIGSFDTKKENTEGDYALVYFRLPEEFPEEDGKYYLYSKFTDWKISEEFELKYSEKHKAYMCATFLKQGFYEYLIAYVPNGTNKIDFEEIEGNRQQTENSYTIIVYHRPFGGLYDQVIGLRTLSSVID